MCPAAGLDNPTADEQFIEPSVAVGVNDAAEVLQMRLRMLPFTVGRIEEQSRRWPRAGEWPLVTEPALAKAGVHSRPVLVLPVPGASTGTGVSPTSRMSPPRT